jgi:6-O-methylguanine DNA methyltransferase, ribonuclease-like domain
MSTLRRIARPLRRGTASIVTVDDCHRGQPSPISARHSVADVRDWLVMNTSDQLCETPSRGSLGVLMYTTIESPIGELLLLGNDRALHGLYMQGGRKPMTIAPEWEHA